MIAVTTTWTLYAILTVQFQGLLYKEVNRYQSEAICEGNKAALAAALAPQRFVCVPLKGEVNVN